MAGNVMELNSASFAQAVEDGVTLVDFWAPWCGPCRAQLPVLESLSSKVNGDAKIAKVNVDEARDLALRFGVQSIPNLILFKDGEVVKNFVGVQPEAVLRQAIDSQN